MILAREHEHSPIPAEPFAPGERIGGAPLESPVYLMRSGAAIEFGTSDDQRFPVALHGPGDLFGWEKGSAPSEVIALAPSEVIALPHATWIRYALATTASAEAYRDLLAARTRAAHQFLRMLTGRKVVTRLQWTLGMLADRFGRYNGAGVELSLRLPQQLLGDVVCASREKVNRALGELRAQGVVAGDRPLIVMAPAPLVEERNL